jgi:hypothetical protein
MQQLNKLVLFLYIFITVIVGAQDTTMVSRENGDVSSLVGLTLGELFSSLGVPQSVYVVRGIEDWQDDVVFVYKEADCYLYRERVWQIGVESAFDIKIGDTRSVVKLVLDRGEPKQNMQEFDGYILCALPSRGWPLTFRINFDNAGKVRAIFIYRPDF